ncbi:hypothetical protein PR202_ga16015 [Eleusine coracana subsp. coracana]|uniref:glucan endo-1,3-beta-D-glucosidase n=1 Tax=Eleusine coracana subsp. coracana TaxID=191504 RepID=A0AAV5CLY5_ELECO|nr:hypothetical protein PR202_ga16015 [Eleusine coracana subsp. coracana]
MANGQTFLLYASAPIHLKQIETTHLAGLGFVGVIQVAYLPDAYMEPVLDQFNGCFPTVGEAELEKPFCLEYTWRKSGPGELLMLAHLLHLRLLRNDGGVKVKLALDDFRYCSIDGDLVGVVRDSWVLHTDPVSATWHSTHGVSEDGVAEVMAALRKDVDALTSTPITITSPYFYGKTIARAARFALIAEEVGCPGVIPAVHRYLKSTVTSWLDETFKENAFLYNSKWGGLITRVGL